MTLPELEFELSAHQYHLMGYPGLRQGESMSLVLDAGVLFPELTADHWFAVQQAPLPGAFIPVGPAHYALAGQIVEAELLKEEDAQSALVTVACGVVPVRITCAPQEDGMLPWGTWETRYLTGIGRVQGIVEEDYRAAVGRPVGMTIWRFRRLVLTPGDPNFGQWHETIELPPQPFRYDRIFVTARVHQDRGYRVPG